YGKDNPTQSSEVDSWEQICGQKNGSSSGSTTTKAPGQRGVGSIYTRRRNHAPNKRGGGFARPWRCLYHSTGRPPSDPGHHLIYGNPCYATRYSIYVFELRFPSYQPDN